MIEPFKSYTSIKRFPPSCISQDRVVEGLNGLGNGLETLNYSGIKLPSAYKLLLTDKIMVYLVSYDAYSVLFELKINSNS